LAQDAAMILATGQRGETMQAIELETRVQGGGVQLPAGARLADGQQVRVVLMYDEPSAATATTPANAVNAGAIARLMQCPIVVSGFVPLSRDEAHER
jgi:hypothetical protein